MGDSEYSAGNYISIGAIMNSPENVITCSLSP